MKTLKITGIIFLSLVSILALHIYIVTRPKVYDPHSRVMARVDIHQNITAAQATAISTWLYRQQGVDHVLCNPETDIVVFTFFPARTSADLLVKNLKSALHLQAVRYVPSQKDLSMSCPMNLSPGTSKVYNFLKQIF